MLNRNYSRTTGARIACLTVLGAAATASFAASSTFDTGFDGWTSTSGVTWTATGGNPGGYLEFADTGPANGGQIVAPGSYSGDWLTTYGATGTFSVDYTVISAGTFQPFPMFVQITGAGGVIAKNLPGNYTSSFGWTTLSNSLVPGNWALLSGTFVGCLSNVTEVRIFMPCASDATEITGIDNVRVAAVPEPGSALAILAGIGGIAARRKRTL